jgi:ATP adenylyltransferase/5',5'''-P-1,P-4-tetraphosphate phosphorylase II
MNPNLDLMSELNLKEIIKNGAYIVTPEMAQEELKRRENLKYNPFKPYENKVFISHGETHRQIIKTGQYDSKFNVLDYEKIYIELDSDEGDEYFAIKKFTSSLDDREVTLFQRYTEVDNDVWEDYLEKYNLSMEYNKGLFRF